MAEGERHVLYLVAIQSARRLVQQGVFSRLRRALSNVQSEPSNGRENSSIEFVLIDLTWSALCDWR